MDSMDVDVLIIGAGVAGLSAAIRIKQQSPDCHVLVLEKASTLGAHTLSGAVFDPKALYELFPDWKERAAPLHTSVTHDRMLWLSSSRAYDVPVPPLLQHKEAYVISLSELVVWLGEQAEALGVDIFPGFAAQTPIVEEGKLQGVITGSFGAGSAQYQEGMEIRAKHTLLAEGCRGSITQEIIQIFALNQHACPQTYGLGFKELWKVAPGTLRAGEVWHTLGWPLSSDIYGGGFVYALDDQTLSVGMVVGLDYQNPYLSPFDEFQRFKTHPKLAEILNAGQRISYGARSLVEGGIQSLPTLSFPGGMLLGDAAGFLNVGRIKGSHAAMKSGILAADALHQSVSYDYLFKASWLYQELWDVRNIRPAFRWGRLCGMVYAAMDQYLFKGRTPWTLKHQHADHQALRPSSAYQPIEYPKPDGVLSFDRASSVYLSNTHHRDGEPCHLILKNEQHTQEVWDHFAGPETRYCPAGVYERDENGQLTIQGQNCIHCKTCDIKDPKQNIRWVPPEAGGGPVYERM